MMGNLIETTIYPTLFSILIVWILVFFIKRSPMILEKITSVRLNKIVPFILLLVLFTLFFSKRSEDISQNIMTYTVELILSFAFVAICAVTWGILDKIDSAQQWFKRAKNINTSKNNKRRNTASREKSQNKPVDESESHKKQELENGSEKSPEEIQLERSVGEGSSNKLNK